MAKISKFIQVCKGRLSFSRTKVCCDFAHSGSRAQLTCWYHTAHGVTYFKYASILMQQMTIEVDEDFIFSLLEFVKFSGITNTEQQISCVLPCPGSQHPTDSRLMNAIANSLMSRTRFLNRSNRRAVETFISKSYIFNRFSWISLS